MIVYRFHIPLAPHAKQRARSSGKTGMHYTPAKTREWESEAARFLRKQARGIIDEPLECFVRVVIANVAPRLKKHSKKGVNTGRLLRKGRTDFDNEAKAGADALVKAGILQDDSWIVDGRSIKWYAATDEEPHVEIFLETLI